VEEILVGGVTFRIPSVPGSLSASRLMGSDRLLLDHASVLSEARIWERVRVGTMLWRAFDKTVRKKPLAGAADAGRYGNSIDFGLKSLARRGFWL